MINSQAKEYASVLFELSCDKKHVGSVFESLNEVLLDKEIYNFFTHPMINKEEKKRILKESLKLEDGELLYFLYVLIDNKKLTLLNDIYEAYQFICDEKANIMRFTVCSPKKLNALKEEKIINVLKKIYNKHIYLNVEVDDKLIGGIVIKHNNEIIDDSILNKINDLKQMLLND